MPGYEIHDTNRPIAHRFLALALLAGLGASLLGGPAMAEEGGEEPAAEAVVTEAPAPPPTEAPVPTPIPTVPPTAVPTEAPPAPTEIPPAPTEAPVVPTEAPAPTDTTATEVPTEEPTATPDAALTWALAAEPDCRLADGEPASVASGAGQVYTCTSTVHLTGSHVVPASVDLTWSARVTVDAGWAVQVLRPKHDANEIVEWTAPKLGEATFTFDPRDPLGNAPEATDLDRTVKVSWGVRIIRPTCTMDESTLRLSHGIAVTAPGATVEADPAMDPNLQPLRIEPSLAPVPDPAVAFAGSLDFGEVGATASGLTETVRTGTMTLNLTGLDAACGDWALALSASTLVDGAGVPLDGSTLVVTAVDGVALTGGSCDLTTGCTVTTLSTGPDASPTRTITLTVELRMPESAALGTFGTTIDATLQPGSASQAPDSPQAMRE